MVREKTYWELDSTKFFRYFIYLDKSSRDADHIFIKNELKVKFMGDWVSEETDWRMVMCRISKIPFANKSKFENSMKELTNLFYIKGYDEDEKISAVLDNYEKMM